MTTMLDRLTDELCSSGCGTSDECERIALRLLKALREPTGEMLKAADRNAGMSYRYVWEVMIGAATKGEG